VVLPAGQLLFNRDLTRPGQVAMAGLVLLTFAVSFSPESRNWASGWVPPLAGLGVLVAFRWPRLAIVIALLVVLAAVIDIPAVQKLILDYKNYDLLTRGAALSIVLEIVKANPVLGVGPANYYYYTPLFPILGYYVRFNSHNNYIDLLAQTGLLGSLFFAWWVLATTRVGWRLRNQVTDGFQRGYIYSCLGGLAACLVASALGDWFLPFVYNIGLNGFRASILGWLFLGGLVAIEQIHKAKASAPSEPVAPAAVTPAQA
jgi:O-antigen ligase